MSKEKSIVRFVVGEQGSDSGLIIEAVSHREAATTYIERTDPVMPTVWVYQLGDEQPFEFQRETKVRRVKR